MKVNKLVPCVVFAPCQQVLVLLKKKKASCNTNKVHPILLGNNGIRLGHAICSVDKKEWRIILFCVNCSGGRVISIQSGEHDGV